MGQTDYSQKVSTYLHSGEKPRLKLNNGTDDYFFDLISKGFSNTVTSNTHQERLQNAYIYLNTHLEEQCAIKKGKKIEYLTDLYDAIVRKLNFTFYSIEDESEIGMTFELMNSRGQSLSILELLKNYLMHWISRNENDEVEKEALIKIVNKSWKEVYTNIALSNGYEDQCLKIAWVLYCTHTPKYWDGYKGFKNIDIIPLRDFSLKSKIGC